MELIKKDPNKKFDLTGQKFGRLTVVEFAGVNKNTRNYYWYCKCDCGNPEKLKISSANLKNGATKSCGCLQKERASEANKKHGDSKTKLFMVWSDMRHRCNNPKHHAYRWYGGKGIKVCEEWDNNYVLFKKWAYSSGYKEGLTIDRKDADKNYCPENCCWASRQQQSSHLSSCNCFEFFNKKYYVSQFCREMKVSRFTFYKYTSDGINVNSLMIVCKNSKSMTDEKWKRLCEKYKETTGKEFEG